MVKKKPRLFATEADLCASFIAFADAEGWTSYAETEGFDILLVRRSDGLQLGLQAKLKFNLEVLGQACPEVFDGGRTGPDHRGILVPEAVGRSRLCEYLGLAVLYPDQKRRVEKGPDGCWAEIVEPRWDPGILDPRCRSWRAYWHDWNPERRIKLPDYVPDVVAGASGPVQLTKWKIAALRVCAALEVRGFVTRDDFKRYGVDHRRWLAPSNWLLPGDVRGTYIRGPSLYFDSQHPTVYPQILAEVTKELAAMPLKPQADLV